MTNRNCVVSKCPTNNIEPDKRGSVFCLPRTDEKRSRWLQLLGRDDLLVVPYLKTVRCRYGVCYLHFTDRHYRTSEKKSLNTNAYPTPIPGIEIPPIKKSNGLRKVSYTPKSKTSPVTVKNIPFREISTTLKSETPILSGVRKIPPTQKSETLIVSGVPQIPSTQKSKISPIVAGITKVTTTLKSTTSPTSIVVPASGIITNDQEISDPLSSPDNESENYPDNYDNLITNLKKCRKRNGRVKNVLVNLKSKTPILSGVIEIPSTQKSKTPISSSIRKLPTTQKSKTPISSNIRKIPTTQKSTTSPITIVDQEISDPLSLSPDDKIEHYPDNSDNSFDDNLIKNPKKRRKRSATSPISIVVPESEIIANDEEIVDPLSLSSDDKIENYPDNSDNSFKDNLIKNPKKRRKRSATSPISIVVPESEIITNDREFSDPLSLSPDDKIENYPDNSDNSFDDNLIKNPKKRRKRSASSPISIVVPQSEIITNDLEIVDPLSLSPDIKSENDSDNYDNLIKNPKKCPKRNGRLKCLLDENGPKKQYMRAKIEEYMKRAETIKNLIANLKENGNSHEQIIIENNSKGHSYEVIFKRFLDAEVTSVIIEDPYIRLFHQCQNLVMFCELLVKNCSNLRNIQLVTIKDQKSDQEKCFQELQQSLAKFNISLIITYSSTLHDRQIKFSTGWTIKIGRGLDYFKKSDGKFSIGTFDYNLRPCHETTIDVFHQSNVKQTYG